MKQWWAIRRLHFELILNKQCALVCQIYCVSVFDLNWFVHSNYSSHSFMCHRFRSYCICIRHSTKWRKYSITKCGNYLVRGCSLANRRAVVDCVADSCLAVEQILDVVALVASMLEPVANKVVEHVQLEPVLHTVEDYALVVDKPNEYCSQNAFVRRRLAHSNQLVLHLRYWAYLGHLADALDTVDSRAAVVRHAIDERDAFDESAVVVDDVGHSLRPHYCDDQKMESLICVHRLVVKILKHYNLPLI